MPTPPVDPATTQTAVFAIKDYLQAGISFLAICVSIYSLKRSEGVAASNIQLKASIDDINNQRHWRREKIYNLSDSLFELGAQYWLVDEDNSPTTKKIALKIRLHLQDIEDNANAIGIDISRIVRELRDEITGGEFESPTRKGIPTDNAKFLKIQIHIQNIKSATANSLITV